MPCSYYLPGEREAIERKEAEDKLALVKRELDDATALLCEISKLDSGTVYTIHTSIPAFSAWQTKHRKMDEMREEAVRLKQKTENEENRKMVEALVTRQEALKKLSAAEIKALRLKKLTKGELELIKKYKHLLKAK